MTRSAWLGPRPPGSPQEQIMLNPAPVTAMAFTPDRKAVATADGTPIVTFWDVANQEVNRRFRDPSGTVNALAISPDGAILATGGAGKVIVLWDLSTGRRRRVLKGHLDTITCLAFAPDGKTLASGSRDASVILWDVAKESERLTLARHTSAITCLAFAADGRALATGSLDFTVRLWDLPSGALRHSFAGHRQPIDAVALAPDGKTLASTSLDGTARLWDLPKLAEIAELTFVDGDEPQVVLPRRNQAREIPQHGPVKAFGPLVFQPDGHSLFLGERDGRIRRCDPLDFRVQARRAGAHAGPVTALALAPGAPLLASAGGDCQLKLWHVDPASPIEEVRPVRAAPGREATASDRR